MFKIEITNDSEKQIEIGKRLSKLFDFDKPAQVLQTLSKVSDADWNKVGDSLEDIVWRAIYDYWVYGCNTNEYLTYGFYNLSHEVKSTYLTHLNRWDYLYHINDRGEADTLENKWDAYLKLKPYFKRDMIRLEFESDYDVFCRFVKKHNTFVVKPIDLSLAVGIHKETLSDDCNLKEYFNKLLEEGNNNKNNHAAAKSSAIILEELIIQSDALACLHPFSVNAIRITTVKTKDGVKVFYPWIKIGMNGDFATCAARGSILAGIDAETGVIYTNGKGEFLQEYEVHPMTGVKIKGLQIPYWKELVDMVTEMAMKLPTVSYVGWDMVLTEKGWLMMEGNWGGEFLGQMMIERGFKRDFEQLIDWSPNKEFWWQKKKK